MSDTDTDVVTWLRSWAKFVARDAPNPKAVDPAERFLEAADTIERLRSGRAAVVLSAPPPDEVVEAVAEGVGEAWGLPWRNRSENSRQKCRTAARAAIEAYQKATGEKP